MSAFVSELEQEAFDGDEFVERLAWRAIATGSDGSGSGESGSSGALRCFALREAFESGVEELRAILDANAKKVERLEMICREEEKKHWLGVAVAAEKCKNCFAAFEALDNKLDAVSAKVVYVGDQLEVIANPRSRAVEAQSLMREFARLATASDGDGDSRVAFGHNDNDNVRSLAERADTIQKLQSIAAELPSGPRFATAVARIAAESESVERALVDAFETSSRADDRTGMAAAARELLPFRSAHAAIVDAYIESSQSAIGASSAHVFAEVLPVCARSERVVREVFGLRAEAVMAKFVLNLFHGKLAEHIESRLRDAVDDRQEEYLRRLHDLYSATQSLASSLHERQTLGCDLQFLNKLTKNIFAKHFDNYMTIEIETLREKFSQILDKYYESKGHQKRTQTSSTIQELKRDLQSKLHRTITATTTTASDGEANESDANTTSALVSEEVAISLLQESKLAARRLALLSRPTDTSANALAVLEALMGALCADHIDYALDVAIAALAHNCESESVVGRMLEVVRTTNAIEHLIEKQFADTFAPLMANSCEVMATAANRKRNAIEQLEAKVNVGLEKWMAIVVANIKHILQSEQRKSDFRPEGGVESGREAFGASQGVTVALATTTNACAKVTRFVSECAKRVRDCLDGHNVTRVLTELGVRWHKVVVDHLQQFSFSLSGAIVVICDVNEYRRVSSSALSIPLVTSLFDALHSLCNLLVVAPDNLRQVCAEVAEQTTNDSLATVDRQVLLSFVQLRADYKSAKIVNQFK